ncbi:uncharacterized protein [Diadema antillarum]|uniref:uncharacterized protein n=1 Tax=Diadema antillarum TaxID=105358 RepID=UPI003A8752CD
MAFFSLVVVLSILAYSSAQVDILTDLGTIRGSQDDLNGETINDFRGIPYAEAPVGERRFFYPVPKSSWGDTVFNATQYGPSCPRVSPSPDQYATMDEDCLFLNIIVPANAVTQNSELPVLVFIPGQGGGADYVGSEMAVRGSVIVVTINYRSEVLGYFSTGDDCIPGNYGLWDQRLAVEWVRDNIGPFGGNGSSITIVGQGKGAVGVSAQILSPRNDNQVFQRAIIQSGVLEDDLHIMSDDDAEDLADEFADSLQCNSSAWASRLDCLRSKSWQDIVSNSPVPGFLPRIDGDFLPEPVGELIERDDIYQYDVIFGFNSDEGVLLSNNTNFPNVTNEEDVRQVLLDMFIDKSDNREDATLGYEMIDLMYVDPVVGLTSEGAAERLLLAVYGDDKLISRSVKYLRRHSESQQANTYMYFFDYVDFDYVRLISDLRTGAASGEELFYLWDLVLGENTTLDAADAQTTSIRTNMTGYWTNFVNTGNPNEGPASPTPSPMWPQFDAANETYLWIKNATEIDEHLKAGFTKLWLEFIPELLTRNQPETCSAEAPVPDILTGNDRDNVDEFIVVSVTDSEDTTLGQVRGTVRTADEGVGGRRIASFLGLPYAEPPIGDLRFRNSRILEDWGENTFRNATEYPAICVQGGGLGQPPLAPVTESEDCLFLNIYAPVIEPDSLPLPVIVYLHSGLYTSGNGVTYDGSTLASYANAVIVPLNYRLGPLGWLSTLDEECPGNFGLIDVVTALQWIQQYISSFGGDPNSVTVFGMGTGAQLGHLISLNGLNDGLMHKIIALGDSVLSPPILRASTKNPLELAEELAQNVECPVTTTRALVECLRSKPAEEVQRASFGQQGLFESNLFPVVDGIVLKNTSDKILQSGDFETIPLLVGATEMDNTIFTSVYSPTGCPNDAIATRILEDVVESIYDGQPEVVSLLDMFYLTSDLSPAVTYDECKIGHQVSELLSDMWLNVPFFETARLLKQADNKDMYVYFLGFRPSDHLYSAFLPPWVELTFGDDVPYAFGWPYDKTITESVGMCFSVADRVVSINFMEMISSFARTGVPQTVLPEVRQWDPFDPASYNALILDVCPYQEPLPRGAEKDIFWNTIIAGLSNFDAYNDDDPPITTTVETSTPSPSTVSSFIGLDVTVEEAGRIIGGLIIALVVLGGLILTAILIMCVSSCCRSNTSNKPV